MSESQTILDYIWSIFLIPVGFIAQKYIGLSNKVSKHDVEIEALKKGISDLCAKHDETNNLLRELNGRFSEHKENSHLK